MSSANKLATKQTTLTANNNHSASKIPQPSQSAKKNPSRSSSSRNKSSKNSSKKPEIHEIINLEKGDFIYNFSTLN